MSIRKIIVNASAVSLLVMASLASAQQTTASAPANTAPGVAGSPPAKDADELARQLSNPVASLISVPFQYNYARTYGDNGYQNLLNIQPVMPFSISDDWNLISRTILPVIQQKNVQPGKTQFGLGDTVQSFFFSPKLPGPNGLIWGVGPAALIPTGTDGIGGDTWAFGPTFVVLKQQGAWTYGALANQLWDTGGAADISSLFMQPFLSKSIGKGRTIALNTETTYNWKSKEWLIPVNLMYARVSKVGKQMVSNQIGVKAYLKTPYGNGPDWGLRYTLTLLFPK